VVKSHSTLPKYGTALFLVLSICVLYVVSRYNYLLFHSTVDIATVFIAACVFIIIWNTRHLIDNNYFLYVAIAFLFFAFLDFIHLLGYKNMGVFPQYGTNLATSLYIASRYILSISLIVAPLFISRKLNATFMFAVYSLVTLLILLSIFYWQIFPVCFVEGVGLTPFKVVSDYIICLILLGAIGLLLINRRSFDSKVLWLFVSSLILSIATGLAFTLYTDPFGIMNLVGHLFQLASFCLVYFAIIEISLNKPQDILFRKLKQSEETLIKKVQELDYANVELQKHHDHLDALVNERTAELSKSYESLRQEMAERKLAEDEIRKLNAELEQRVFERTTQLEAANRELEAFAYSVSHDLRAPLRGIDGWSLALLEDCKDKLDEKESQYLDLVRSETQIMGRLIDDLLTFSRQSRREMKQQRLDMTAIAQAVVSRLQQQNPTIQADFIIQSGLTAQGDAGLIEIALNNLLDNAAKFSSKRSRAVIEFGQVEQEGKKAFFVRDNGVGFDMAYAHKLFGVFRRLHKSSEFPGTGIGLASVQRIINRHGGLVWADAKVNQGATFYFTLKEAT